MSTEKKSRLLPKLRFPEFRGAEGWTPKEFGDCLDYLQPTPYLVNSTAYSDRYEIPVVTAGKTFILGYTNETDGVFDQPLPAIIFDDFTTASQFVDFPFKAKSSAMKILLAKKDFNIKFGYESMQRIDYEVGAHGRHWISAYAKILLPVPGPTEQQKIADCLSSLDELIAAEARKVEALKTHKKGLMQQLFPREGETQPRLRFPEFQNAEDWEMKSLGSFSKVGDIDHKMPPSTAHGIPYIMTGDFFGMNDIDYENAKKISIEDYEQLSKKIKPELGDIIIARYASVGAVRYIQTRLKFLASYSCAVIKCNKLEDSRYIYYALQSDVIQSQIRLEINTSSQKNIGIDSIKKLNVFLPTLSEQLKISACLAVLDTQITAATQELDTLKTRKKGLMQQLFPSMELVHP